MENNNFDRVNRLLNQELDLESIIGYHSTSVEAVFILAQTRGLLGYGEQHRPKEGISVYGPSYLYLTPIRDMFKGTPFYETLGGVSGDMFWTGPNSYAESNAFRHYLAGQLGFTPQRPDLSVLSTYTERHSDLSQEQLALLIQESKKHGIKEPEVRAIVEQAWTRKGIHIGLSPKILELQLEPDPEDEEALRIYCPGGLPIDYVASLTPASIVDRMVLGHYLNTNKPLKFITPQTPQQKPLLGFQFQPQQSTLPDNSCLQT